MKPQSFLRFVLLCTAMLAISKSFAQNLSDYALSGTTINVSAVIPVINRIGDISIKAQRTFITYFKNADNESWSKINKNYFVNFIIEGRKNRAMITETGILVYTILYGVEKDLPKDIRNQIKQTYYDYNIITAIQVQENKRIIWVIQMEDEKKNLTIRVEDGEMEEVQQFIKS